MASIARPIVVLMVLLSGVLASGAEPIDKALGKVDEKTGITWYDIRQLGVEGQGWTDTKAPFDRLPQQAEGVVRDPVWNLSHHSAGLCVRFVTDSTAIHCRWSLTSASLAMPHMPATGVSGVDLYVKTPTGWKWLAIGQPSAQSNTVALVNGIPAESREYLLYLPLYNGVSSVEVGVAGQAPIAKAPAWTGGGKPIVFYGTSITQGGCASRPGMVHTAILQRRLQRPVINLGFSGNGRMEPEMAKLFAELDPEVYVLDCLPNMSAAEVTERVEPFVKTVRQARPQTPILFVEDRSYSNDFLVASNKQRNTDSRKALREAVDRLLKSGMENLHYLKGDELLGDDNEGTVDSSHPTDLGFFRQADAFEKPLQLILKK